MHLFVNSLGSTHESVHPSVRSYIEHPWPYSQPQRRHITTCTAHKLPLYKSIPNIIRIDSRVVITYYTYRFVISMHMQPAIGITKCPSIYSRINLLYALAYHRWSWGPGFAYKARVNCILPRCISLLTKGTYAKYVYRTLRQVYIEFSPLMPVEPRLPLTSYDSQLKARRTYLVP